MGALEWAGHSAEKADPYRQAVTFGDGRLFVAARGGGGGGSQLLPADLLREVLEDAHRAVRSSAGAGELLRLFCAVDEAMGRVMTDERDGLQQYCGSPAQLVAALEVDGELSVGNVGLGRAWLVTGQAITCVTRDDSIFEDFVETRPSPEDLARFTSSQERAILHQVATTLMNGEWRASRPGWTPREVSLDGAAGLLLTTDTTHEHVSPEQLHRWALEALATPELDRGAATLWGRLREDLGRLPRGDGLRLRFDRTAAVLLARRRHDSAG